MKHVFKILFITLSLMLILASSATTVFAEQNETVAEGEQVADTKEAVDEYLVEQTYLDEDGNLIYVLEDGRKYNSETKEWIVEEIEKMSLALSFDRIPKSFQYMWQGMLCIFVVIGVIILVTLLMNSLCNKLDVKKNEKETKE